MKFGKWANYGPEKELIKLFLDAFRVCYSAPSALPSAVEFYVSVLVLLLL